MLHRSSECCVSRHAHSVHLKHDPLFTCKQAISLARKLMKLKALVLFLGLTAVILALSGCSRKEEAPQNPFQKPLHTRVYVDNAGTIRTVNFADDGVTPINEQLSNKDGSFSEIFYRPNFSAWRRIDYFPSADEQHRQMKREIVFGPNGYKYVSHTSFREDGSKESEGVRLPSQKYETTEFFKDGKTVARKIVSLEGGDKESVITYRENGSLETQTTYVKGSTYTSSEMLHFNESGVADYRVKDSDNDWSRKETEVFFPGTMKVQFVVEKSDNSTSGRVEQRNLNGELVKEWSFQTDKIYVTVYGTGQGGTTPLYKQYWIRTDPTPSATSNVMHFELDAVEEMDYKVPADDSHDPRLGRLIEFDPGQDRPSHMIIKEPYSYSSAKTTLYLNKDGKVERQVVVTPGKSWSDKDTETETKHDPAIALDKPIDWERCKYVPFDVKGLDLPVIEARPVYSGETK